MKYKTSEINIYSKVSIASCLKNIFDSIKVLEAICYLF